MLQISVVDREKGLNLSSTPTQASKLMGDNLLYLIIGWLGSIGLILGYLPQAIQTIRTRQTDGISLPGFCMMAVGSFCFMCQGLMLCVSQGISTGIFFFITNFITATCAIIIFIIKMRNDHMKKK